ncbi:MAG: hypothetical protein ABJA82_02795 [Myxococcales bacterium]
MDATSKRAGSTAKRASAIPRAQRAAEVMADAVAAGFRFEATSRGTRVWGNLGARVGIWPEMLKQAGAIFELLTAPGTATSGSPPFQPTAGESFAELPKGDAYRAPGIRPRPAQRPAAREHATEKGHASSNVLRAHEFLTKVAATLTAKNAAYGDSAAHPLRIFTKASPEEQLRVRIDDKLSRLARGDGPRDEDTLLDLVGYVALLAASRANGDRP